MVKYLLKKILDGGFGLLFVVCGLRGEVGGGYELGVFVEVCFCLLVVSSSLEK